MRSLNLWEALHASQDLHVTLGILFPNKKETNVLQSLIETVVTDMTFSGKMIQFMPTNQPKKKLYYGYIYIYLIWVMRPG